MAFKALVEYHADGEREFERAVIIWWLKIQLQLKTGSNSPALSWVLSITLCPQLLYCICLAWPRSRTALYLLSTGFYLAVKLKQRTTPPPGIHRIFPTPIPRAECSSPTHSAINVGQGTSATVLPRCHRARGGEVLRARACFVSLCPRGDEDGVATAGFLS